MINVEALLPWLSFALGLIAIYGFYNQRKRSAMEQGKRQAAVDELRRDLDTVKVEIKTLQDDSRCTDISLAELKTDMASVIKALDRIEGRINTLYNIEKGKE
jgi:hypothetical protein